MAKPSGLVSRSVGLFASVWLSSPRGPSPLKKSDDIAVDSTFQLLNSPLPVARVAGAAGLFIVSYLSYLPTLEPIETPEDIHERLGVLIELTLLSCCSFVGGLLLYLSSTKDVKCLQAQLSAPSRKSGVRPVSLGWYAASLTSQWSRAKGLALRVLPFAYPLILAGTDFGSSLDHHGAYNFIAFVALTMPVLLGAMLLTACIRRLRLSRPQSLAVACAVGVWLVYWMLSLRGLRDHWHDGIAGQRMLEGEEAVAAALQAHADSSGEVLPEAARLRSAKVLPDVARLRAAREQSKPGGRFDPSAGPCSWDYSRIWVPLYDSSLMRSTVRALTGVAAPCRAPVIQDFALTVVHASRNADAAVGDADAALFTESSIAAAAAAASCDPRDATLYRPVSVEVRGCPATLRLRYRLPRDARPMLAEPKHGESALQRAAYMSQPLIDAQALRAADGSAVIYIGATTFGESIEVHCGGGPHGIDGSGALAPQAAGATAEGASGSAESVSGADAGSGEIEYASFVRPRRDVLIRLRRWWGRSALSPLLARVPAPPTAGLQPPNVLHIVLDAVSRLQARRQLPLTIALLEELQLANSARSQSLATAADADAGADALAAGARADGGASAAGAGAAAADVIEMFRLHSNGATTGPNAGVLLTGEWDAHPGSEMIWEKATRRAGYVNAALYGMCEDFAGEYLQFSSQSDHEPGVMFCASSAYPLGSPTSLWAGPFSSTRRCMGRRMVHERSLEWTSNFWRTYAGAPKWMLLTLLEGHESTGEVLSTADADLAAFLRRLLIEEGGYRDTVVVLQADHGLHMGAGYVLTAQGRIEHMNPAAWIVLPPEEHLPALGQAERLALRANAQRLVTQADIFMTLHQLMTTPLGNPAASDVGASALQGWMPQPAFPPRCEADAPDMRKRPDRAHTQHLPRSDAPTGSSVPPSSWTDPVLPGVSLLGPEPLPLSRSCADAGIKAKYCRCV